MEKVGTGLEEDEDGFKIGNINNLSYWLLQNNLNPGLGSKTFKSPLLDVKTVAKV